MISIAGTRMQSAAVLWQVHEINRQPLALGGVGLANIFPVIILSLLAGAAADAFNRRRLILLTQTSLALLALTLGLLTLRGLTPLWVVYLITAVSAAVGTFDLPARQALVPNLLPRELLTNAFSLNSIAFHVGSVVGPTLGGLVIARWGVGAAYVINAVSYLAVIGALLLIGPVPQERALPAEGDGPAWSPRAIVTSVTEGMRFVVGRPVVFSSMLLDFFATFFSSAAALLPIFARSILQVGAVGYGWLVAAPSLGSAAVALVLSLRGTLRRQGRVLFLAVTAFGFATIVFGVSHNFWLTFAALAATGGTDTVSTVIRNTLRQLQTPDRLRGRMTSVSQLFFMGGPQLGEFEAGLVAQIFGPAVSVVTGGVGCLLATAWVARRFPQLLHYDGSEATLAADTVPATQASSD